jgi:hypothetical protein
MHTSLQNEDQNIVNCIVYDNIFLTDMIVLYEDYIQERPWYCYNLLSYFYIHFAYQIDKAT